MNACSYSNQILQLTWLMKEKPQGNKGKQPNVESQSDLLSFGVATSHGILQSRYHHEQVSSMNGILGLIP